jgi:hypothetical protein
VIIATSVWAIVPIIVGAVTAFGGLATWFVNGVRAERTRLQKLYSDAYSAVVSYQEFPYVIRRRQAPTPGHEQVGGEERLRISAGLHTVQEELNNYRAQIATESRAVSTKYDALVGETRRIAGSYMHQAWNMPPLDNDAGMNISGIDYSGLKPAQDDYLAAVRTNMSFWRVALPRLWAN